MLDLDEKNRAGTVATGIAFLDGLGLAGKFPHVVTPSGGAHAYLRLTSSTPGNYRNLAGDLAGELRYGPGSYVGAPPSVLATGNAYRLIAGDFADIPGVTWSDLLPLLGTVTTTADGPALAPIPGATADKLLAMALLAETHHRHNTGFWLARGLRNSGAPMRQAEAVMREYAANVTQDGHPYTEAEALATLRSTYSHPGHANYGGQVALDELAAGLMWAESHTWPGRTGRTDKAILTAHLQTGWRACATVWDVSVRDVAERTGTGTATAVRATNRLIDAGILNREATADRTEAASYRLGAQAAAPFQSGSQKQLDTSEARIKSDSNNNSSLTAPTAAGKGGAGGNRQRAATDATADTPTDSNCFCDPLRDVTRSLDAFRFRALGPSAADVYDALATGPGMCSELAGRARMSKPTAWRALKLLQANGLATQIAGTWHRLDADLDALAASLGTAGARKRQAAQHERERESWRELCRLRLQNAARQPMPEAELVNPARILAGRQTQAENRRKVETPPPLATQIATSTSTPPPLAAASTATETAAGAPTETAATATQTPTPAHVAGIMHELAGAMRWEKRWPDWKPQRTAAEYEERRRFLLAQVAQYEREQAQAYA